MAAGSVKPFAGTTGLFVLEQIFPRTTQRHLQPKDRRQQNIHIASFDLLNNYPIYNLYSLQGSQHAAIFG